MEIPPFIINSLLAFRYLQLLLFHVKLLDFYEMK